MVAVRDSWPVALPKFVRGNGPVALLGASDRVPISEQDMEGWCYIGRNRDEVDPSRRSALFYRSPGGSPRKEVMLRLQGFIREVRLHPLGSWNG